MPSQLIPAFSKNCCSTLAAPAKPKAIISIEITSITAEINLPDFFLRGLRILPFFAGGAGCATGEWAVFDAVAWAAGGGELTSLYLTGIAFWYLLFVWCRCEVVFFVLDELGDPSDPRSFKNKNSKPRGKKAMSKMKITTHDITSPVLSSSLKLFPRLSLNFHYPASLMLHIPIHYTKVSPFCEVK